MTRRFHDTRKGRKALFYGSAQAIGPLTNPRHPRKLKLVPVDKKTAPSAANTEDGKEAQHDT